MAAPAWWLAARVRWDSFSRDPGRFIEGVGWRLRGLKLRARNRFAALGGHSPYAYRLWMARHERASARPGGDGDIAVLVDDGTGMAALADRLGSPREERRWVLLTHHRDRLAADAAARYAEAVAAAPAGTRLVYADDDLLDAAGRRHAPHFKPDWNPELLAGHDYLTHAAALYVSPDEIAAAPDAAALVAAVVADPAAAPPVHLRLVLHHRAARPDPQLPLPPGPALPDPAPHVTIIVPTRDRIDLLAQCVAGIEATDYPAFDVIVIDNDSVEPATQAFFAALDPARYRVLPVAGPFNYAAMNNVAAAAATGDYLCFLNNDIEMIGRDWLARLVAQAVRPDAGAVGARLLYDDGSIQHAGVVLGIGGAAAHAHRFLPADAPGYFHRAALPQRVSAVTAACLVVAKAKFTRVGGFDAERFPVAFNDVDLCLKLGEAGWVNLYEPRATLVHHESKSRGDDSGRVESARFLGELRALKARWKTDTARDPFHHPDLTPFTEQFLPSI